MAEKIKVIWVVNVLFPEACEKLGIESPVIGGWLYSYKNIVDRYCPNVALYIVAPYNGNKFVVLECGNSFYYAFPERFNNKKLSEWFISINRAVQPDIIHIHGSEYVHSNIFSSICDRRRTVLSIQGMMSVYSKYIYSGIEYRQLFSAFSIRDILKRERIYDLYCNFVKSGKKEIDLISSIDNVIGRTSWDKSNSLAINGILNYFKCQEPLRDMFYKNSWNIDKCEKHAIFLSQVHYSIKGLHVFLKALPLIKRKYPNVKVYITGNDLTTKPWYRITTYWRYIRNEIKKLGVADNLVFLGKLDEASMVQAFLRANVFVCPSSIENSSNSVCEAQLLGTPVIASYVGGMMDLIEDGKTGLLYRFEEYAMLADKICFLFENTEYALYLSENARKVAKVRHNMKNIALSLNSIYDSIIRNNLKK